MLRLLPAPTFLKPEAAREVRSPRRGGMSAPAPLSPRRLRCRAQNEPTLAERALRSPDDRVRRWGLTEIVRLQPTDGGKDALRCATLAQFVRLSPSSDHHVLLDAIDTHGLSPRMLPVFQELMQTESPEVKSRALPLWSALIGLYRLSAGARDGVRVEAEWARREHRGLSTE